MDKNVQALAALMGDLSAQVSYLETTLTNLLTRLEDIHPADVRFEELRGDLAEVWPDAERLLANEAYAIWLAKGVGIDEIPGDG